MMWFYIFALLPGVFVTNILGVGHYDRGKGSVTACMLVMHEDLDIKFGSRICFSADVQTESFIVMDFPELGFI